MQDFETVSEPRHLPKGWWQRTLPRRTARSTRTPTN